jgi:hypothetical protein
VAAEIPGKPHRNGRGKRHEVGIPAYEHMVGQGSDHPEAHGSGNDSGNGTSTQPTNGEMRARRHVPAREIP